MQKRDGTLGGHADMLAINTRAPYILRAAVAVLAHRGRRFFSRLPCDGKSCDNGKCRRMGRKFAEARKRPPLSIQHQCKSERVHGSSAGRCHSELSVVAVA
jgi:hypothetical protein